MVVIATCDSMKLCDFFYKVVITYAYRMAYLLKDNPSGISAREQVMYIFSGLILVKDTESKILEALDNSCESRLREQFFCRNKPTNPVLSVRKLQYDGCAFENRY